MVRPFPGRLPGRCRDLPAEDSAGLYPYRLPPHQGGVPGAVAFGRRGVRVCRHGPVSVQHQRQQRADFAALAGRHVRRGEAPAPGRGLYHRWPFLPPDPLRAGPAPDGHLCRAGRQRSRLARGGGRPSAGREAVGVYPQRRGAGRCRGGGVERYRCDPPGQGRCPPGRGLPRLAAGGRAAGGFPFADG